MYLILWLLLNETSQAFAGTPQASPGGHVPDPLAITEGH